MKVKKINNKTFEVKSETVDGLWYDVTQRRDGSWYCDCLSYKHHSNECKHIREVLNYNKIKWQVFKPNGWVDAVGVPTDWTNATYIGEQQDYIYWIAWDFPEFPIRYRCEVY